MISRLHHCRINPCIDTFNCFSLLLTVQRSFSTAMSLITRIIILIFQVILDKCIEYSGREVDKDYKVFEVPYIVSKCSWFTLRMNVHLFNPSRLSFVAIAISDECLAAYENCIVHHLLGFLNKNTFCCRSLIISTYWTLILTKNKFSTVHW